ncbi:SDR family oxidoreductase [Salsuginibacillus kocurii]|uniref:SDR family oxidoreductase n=1 Tax=Salsuginibacillus kocurii TaxID=427078 RepID=UPI00037E9AED|nr:SDR family oxidoreductase [Salsuginibacillus kocurii]
MNSLAGKTALVTGASSGIGAAVAKDLAGRGAGVVLTARRVERIEALEQEIKDAGGEAKAVAADVTKKEDMENVAAVAEETFGTVDILINNAGVMLLSMLKNDQVDEWAQMVDVNIKGVLYGVHAVLPNMLEKGNGHVVNVSSVAGHEVMPSSSVYSATKFAVRAFSVGMEKELSGLGVRVTNISPGVVETELTTHITDEEVKSRFEGAEMSSLQAEDIANAVGYAVTQPEEVNVNEVTVRPMKG